MHCISYREIISLKSRVFTCTADPKQLPSREVTINEWLCPSSGGLLIHGNSATGEIRTLVGRSVNNVQAVRLVEGGPDIEIYSLTDAEWPADSLQPTRSTLEVSGVAIDTLRPCTQAPTCVISLCASAEVALVNGQVLNFRKERRKTSNLATAQWEETVSHLRVLFQSPSFALRVIISDLLSEVTLEQHLVDGVQTYLRAENPILTDADENEAGNALLALMALLTQVDGKACEAGSKRRRLEVRGLESSVQSKPIINFAMRLYLASFVCSALEPYREVMASLLPADLALTYCLDKVLLTSTEPATFLARLSGCLAQWAGWMRVTLGKNEDGLTAYPDPAHLLRLYANRKEYHLRMSSDLMRVTPLSVDHLRAVPMDVARGLAYFWGRWDLLFNLHLWPVTASRSLSAQRPISIDGAAWTHLGALPRDKVVQRLERAWDLSRSHQLKWNEHSVIISNVLQHDLNLSLATLFGSTLSTVGTARCRSRPLTLPKLVWERQWWQRGSRQRESPTSAGRPISTEAPGAQRPASPRQGQGGGAAANGVVGAGISVSAGGDADGDDVSAASPRDGSGPQKVELNWGVRGTGDCLSAWTDFHMGLKLALSLPRADEILRVSDVLHSLSSLTVDKPHASIGADQSTTSETVTPANMSGKNAQETGKGTEEVTKVVMGNKEESVEHLDSLESSEKPPNGEMTLTLICQWLDQVFGERLDEEQRSVIMNQPIFQRFTHQGLPASRGSSAVQSPGSLATAAHGLMRDGGGHTHHPDFEGIDIVDSLRDPLGEHLASPVAPQMGSPIGVPVGFETPTRNLSLRRSSAGSRAPSAPLLVSSRSATEPIDSLSVRANAVDVFASLWRNLRLSMFWAGAYLGLGLHGYLRGASGKWADMNESLRERTRRLCGGSRCMAHGVFMNPVPASIEMTMESSMHGAPFEPEYVPVHHLALHLCILMGQVLSLVSVGQPSVGRRELFKQCIQTLYPPVAEGDSYVPTIGVYPHKMDTYLYLATAMLCDSPSVSAMLAYRVLLEWELVAFAGYSDPQFIDNFSYGGLSTTKRATDEDVLVFRRALLLGGALGLLVQRSENAALFGAVATDALSILLTRSNKPLVLGKCEQNTAPNEVGCLATKTAGAKTAFYEDAAWGAALALGLAYFATNDGSVKESLQLSAASADVRHITPTMLKARLLAFALVSWNNLDVNVTWVTEIVPLSVLLFNRCVRDEALHGLGYAAFHLREVFNSLHPTSPLEYAIARHVEANGIEIAFDTTYLSPYHWYQLHVTTTATVAWIMGLRDMGLSTPETRSFILRSLKWIDALPTGRSLLPSAGDAPSASSVRNLSSFMSLASQLWHEWKEEIKVYPDLQSTSTRPPGHLSELFMGLAFFAVDDAILKSALSMLIAGLGVLCAASLDTEALQAIQRWVSSSLQTRWSGSCALKGASDSSDPEDTAGAAGTVSTASCTAPTVGSIGEKTEVAGWVGAQTEEDGDWTPCDDRVGRHLEGKHLYSHHQICSWAMGLIVYGGGSFSPDMTILESRPLTVLIQILASFPTMMFRNLVDNRPLPQCFRFLICSLMRDATVDLYEANAGPQGDTVELTAPETLGECSFWLTEHMAASQREALSRLDAKDVSPHATRESRCLKAICLSSYVSTLR